MPKFVIEREITAAGKLPPQELQAISQKSCSVLHDMGPQIQWVQSYVTDDKIYCVYNAPDEATVRTHAQKGGFPANVSRAFARSSIRLRRNSADQGSPIDRHSKRISHAWKMPARLVRAADTAHVVAALTSWRAAF